MTLDTPRHLGFTAQSELIGQKDDGSGAPLLNVGDISGDPLHQQDGQQGVDPHGGDDGVLIPVRRTLLHRRCSSWTGGALPVLRWGAACSTCTILCDMGHKKRSARCGKVQEIERSKASGGAALTMAQSISDGAEFSELSSRLILEK